MVRITLYELYTHRPAGARGLRCHRLDTIDHRLQATRYQVVYTRYRYNRARAVYVAATYWYLSIYVHNPQA